MPEVRLEFRFGTLLAKDYTNLEGSSVPINELVSLFYVMCTIYYVYIIFFLPWYQHFVSYLT